jgi:predicted DNA-binding transcriptional regulator AlpA
MHQIENIQRDNFAGDVMLSHDKAAALIGISRRTLFRHRLAGGGPVYRRIGKHILYPQSAVAAYIAANTVTPSSGKGVQVA